MKFQGFVGPTYQLDSVNVDCQRCINLYPESLQPGTGKEGNQYYFKSTPGLDKLFEVGSGPIRMIYVMKTSKDDLFPPNRVLVASGSELFSCKYVSGTWITTKVEDLGTSEGPIIIQSTSGKDLIVPEDPPMPSVQGFYDEAILTDGVYVYFFSAGWTKLGSGPKVYAETLTSLSYENASHVVLIDGFYIINELGTSTFRVSDWRSPNFGALSFASAEGNEDNIVALIDRQRELWIIGEKTIEIWMNTGNADFPFERVSGGFIEKGCAAPYSVAKIDSTIIWLGRDQSGQGVIYGASGATPQRISTHAVEQAIAKYSDISKATAFAYQNKGHSFYVINFDEGTWVFDFSTGLWHERARTLESGELGRHKAERHDFFAPLGIHLVGDFENGNIYALKDDVYLDDTEVITRLRRSPHLSSNKKRIFHHSLELDMETGIGLDGEVQGSDPQVMMRFSNDGGHTWSSESWISAGKKIGGIGDFKKRVKWNRLGSAYDRVYEIKITDPVPVTILGAEIEVEVGKS